MLIHYYGIGSTLMLQPGAFENLAIEIFTRCKPKDAKGNKMDCPNCQASIPEW